MSYFIEEKRQEQEKLLNQIKLAEELAEENDTTVVEEFEKMLESKPVSKHYEELTYHNEVNKFYVRYDGLVTLKVDNDNDDRSGFSNYYFDICDYERVIKKRWYVNKDGFAVSENGVLLHDYIMQPNTGEYVYFVERETFHNNTRENLGVTDRPVVLKKRKRRF